MRGQEKIPPIRPQNRGKLYFYIKTPLLYRLFIYWGNWVNREKSKGIRLVARVLTNSRIGGIGRIARISAVLRVFAPGHVFLRGFAWEIPRPNRSRGLFLILYIDLQKAHNLYYVYFLGFYLYIVRGPVPSVCAAVPACVRGGLRAPSHFCRRGGGGGHKVGV